MFMFSKKGLVAFIGIGILLSVLGPCDAIKCYECVDSTDNSDVPACDHPTPKDCPNSKGCYKSWLPASGKEGVMLGCGDSEQLPQKATTCVAKSASIKSCHCFTDLCNDLQLKYDGPVAAGPKGRPSKKEKGRSEPATAGECKKVAALSSGIAFGTVLVICRYLQGRLNY